MTASKWLISYVSSSLFSVYLKPMWYWSTFSLVYLLVMWLVLITSHSGWELPLSAVSSVRLRPSRSPCPLYQSQHKEVRSCGSSFSLMLMHILSLLHTNVFWPRLLWAYEWISICFQGIDHSFMWLLIKERLYYLLSNIRHLLYCTLNTRVMAKIMYWSKTRLEWDTDWVHSKCFTGFYWITGVADRILSFPFFNPCINRLNLKPVIGD